MSTQRSNPIADWTAYLSGWISITLYGFLVFELLRLWTHPTDADALRVLTLAVMMAMEFIMAHSGVFMAAMSRSKAMIILIPFYGLFAWGFSSYVPGNDMMWLYFGVVAMRMRFAFSNPTEDQVGRNIGLSAVVVMTYFVLIFIFAFNADNIPLFGLTPEYLTASGYHDLHDSGGIFIDQPNVALAMGVVYFTLIAIWEFLIYGMLKWPGRKDKSGHQNPST
ncbi:hypothetical protein [Fretibacter rubidus]|uniref:hypothetical protein n=1 Tax=Fretibacter rubidus TaxID=570162 RepID=UPI00352AC28D